MSVVENDSSDLNSDYDSSSVHESELISVGSASVSNGTNTPPCDIETDSDDDEAYELWEYFSVPKLIPKIDRVNIIITMLGSCRETREKLTTDTSVTFEELINNMDVLQQYDLLRKVLSEHVEKNIKAGPNCPYMARHLKRLSKGIIGFDNEKNT